MQKNKINAKQHHHFHWIHLIAVFILGGYFTLSKVHLVWSLQGDNIIYLFLKIYLFGTFFACLFLYIFSHERFFLFAKEIEKQEANNEKKYLKKYIHHGKILGTFIIGAVGGPVFSSLTARFLLNDYPLKYLIVVLANVLSTFITVAITKGVIHLL